MRQRMFLKPLAMLAVVAMVSGSTGVVLAQRGRGRAGGSVRQTRQPDPGVNQAGRAGNVDPGFNQPGRAGNAPGVGADPGFNQPGRYGNVDPGFNQPGRVGNVGGVRAVAYPVPAGAYYQSYDAWRVAAGVAAVIAIGTILTMPPPQTTVVVVQQTTYYMADGVYYQEVMSSGQVVYQVVPAPSGAW